MSILKRCFNEALLEAGCDEAGRGCLAGPVFAAAVILPANFNCPDLNDSKQLTARKRAQLKEVIISQALSWGVGWATPKEIDEINILNASILSMHRAVSKLHIQPDYLLIDGNRFKHPYQLISRFPSISDYSVIEPVNNIPFHCEIKGDGRFLNIAAASVLAKTFRDAYMLEMHQRYPNYAWDQNMGYPTKKHREAIVQYGICEEHRHSFKLTENQLSLHFED